MEEDWFSEGEIAGYENRYLITDVLYEGRSEFQDLKVVESKAFGRILVLDGYVQTTEVDEFIYHETLVHVPMCVHPDPKHVLIIGGGDGGTLRHVLKHPIENAVMVELDPEVTRVSREFLPAISAGAFEDPRTTLHFADGAAYVKAPEHKFDVILVDSTDPIGPAEILISEGFYGDCRNALADGGIIAVQSGTPVYQGNEYYKLNKNLAAVFGETHNYWSAVPTYPGTLWSFSCGVKGIDVQTRTQADISTRVATLGDDLKFFNQNYFRGAFLVPEFMNTLKATGKSPFIR